MNKALKDFLQFNANNPLESPKNSLVDEVINAGETGPVEPEDQFGKPKQLSTIAGLRKKGYDNATIFKAMELEEAEAESTKQPEPNNTPEKPTPEPAMYAQKDNMWETLYKPTAQFFLAGGWKEPIGLAGMALGTTIPREEREVYSPKEGFGYTVPEITPEDALIASSNNPLYRKGSALFADALVELAERPDLQPSENFMEYEWSDPEFIAGTIGQALPSFLSFVIPAATTALVTKNPIATVGVTMSTAFGLETGSMMETAMENGLSPRDAANVAITVGTINSMISAIPASTLFTKIGIGKKPLNDVMVKSIIDKQLFKDVGRKSFIQGASETLEELLQEGVNILAETQELGIKMTDEELAKRLQAVVIGAGALGTATGSVAGVAQTGTRVGETKKKIQADFIKEKITIESQAKAISEDKANDFNIEYDIKDDGSQLLTEQEIKDTGYAIDLNNIPEAETNEKGEKLYAVKVKGETDSEGNIRLTSSADRSTVLEEAIESRLKRLQKSKKAEDKRLIEKINFWTESVRKKASEMGLELRFTEEGEGNIELFSDAILYTKGGFTGLSKEFQDAIYIPDDISSEFIANFGEMSDGSSVFEILQGSEKGIQANQEFAAAVDADIASQMDMGVQKTRPPPAKPPIKSKIGKETESGSYQLEPDVVAKAVGFYPDVLAPGKDGKPTPKAGRLNRLKGRLKTRKTKANPIQKDIPLEKMVGKPANKTSRKFELINGGIAWVGLEKTGEQWLEQVYSVLSEEQQVSASLWYDDAYPIFVEEFGETDAVPNMVAWLMGNVNASPQQALSNLFLSREQLRSQLASQKSAGLPSAAKNVKKILAGERTTSGAGVKLFDFLDSALGKTTRTIMQDDPEGGAPIADDRHTNRDMGFVDSTFKNRLYELAKNPEEVKSLRIDQKATYKNQYDKKTGKLLRNKDGTLKKKRTVPGPNETQYEWAVRKFNKLSNELNEMGYLGGNLKPFQHQAIGWTAIAKMLGTSDGMSIAESFANQTPTLAYELNFGTSTPYAARYGDAYKKMSLDEQVELTKKTVMEVIPELAKDIGITVRNINTDIVGGWKGEVSANSTLEVRGSDQAINGLADAIGYLFQQDAVGIIKLSTAYDGLGIAFSHDDLIDRDLMERAYKIIYEETDDKFAPGFFYDELTDPERELNQAPSMIIGSKIKQSQFDDYKGRLDSALERIRNELNIDLNLNRFGNKYEERENNWSKKTQGESYRDSILESFGLPLQKRLDDYHGPKVEAILEQAFARSAEKKRKSRQLIPDPDFAAEIRANQQLDKRMDENESERLRDLLYRKIVDKLDPVLMWQKEIEDTFLGGARIRDHQNVYLHAELFVGRVPELLKDFDDKIINVNNKDSFVSRLIAEDITIEDFNTYLHSLHAQERNAKMGEDGLSGMSDKTAKQEYKRLNKKHGRVKLRKYVAEFRKDVVDASLEYRLKSGLIDQDTFDRLRDTYKNYVPLFRVMDDADSTIDSANKPSAIQRAKSSIGKGFDVVGKEFFKSKGSKKEVKNILVSAVEQYHSSLIRSEKNLVNRRLVSLIESYPSDSYSVLGIKHQPEYDENGEIKYMVPNKAVKDADGNIYNQKDVLHVKVDGQSKAIVFQGERGQRIMNAMKDMGTSKGFKSLYAFTNYLRYVNTIANPEFIFTNFIRDIQTAGINIAAEQGNQIMTQSMSPSALKQSWKTVYNVLQNEEKDTEWSNMYDRLRRAGGKTGFFDYKTIEEKVAEAEKNLRRVEEKGIGIKKAGKSLFDFIENLNEATESAVRLSLFKAMLENGFSEEQSAMAAKNVTINFNRKGELGQFVNSLYLFANAGIQGSQRIYGVIKNSKKAQAAVSGLAALGVTESFINNMSNDDEEYDKIPDWEKDNNLILRYGDDKYFKIRLPYGYNMFKVVGNIAGDIAWARMDNKPVEMSRQFERFLVGMNNAFNPINGGNLVQMLSPTATDPLVQLSLNQEFHGGPMKPEVVYGPDKAEVEKAWERTPGVYKNFSQWYFKLMGGHIRYNPDGSIAHAVRGPGGRFGDVSPEVFEYFVDYMGGGLGKTVLRTLNTGKGVVNYDADYSKAPFVRQFYGKFEKKSESRILYDYERRMSKELFDEKLRLKYLGYLESYAKKGNLSSKEYMQRYKRFVKAQAKVKQTIAYSEK